MASWNNNSLWNSLNLLHKTHINVPGIEAFMRLQNVYTCEYSIEQNGPIRHIEAYRAGWWIEYALIFLRANRNFLWALEAFKAASELYILFVFYVFYIDFFLCHTFLYLINNILRWNGWQNAQIHRTKYMKSYKPKWNKTHEMYKMLHIIAYSRNNSKYTDFSGWWGKIVVQLSSSSKCLQIIYGGT